MNTVKTEAIATADAHLNNVGIPSYSDLAEMVAKLMEDVRARQQYEPNAGSAARLSEAKAMLDRVAV